MIMGATDDVRRYPGRYMANGPVNILVVRDLVERCLDDDSVVVLLVYSFLIFVARVFFVLFVDVENFDGSVTSTTIISGRCSSKIVVCVAG